MLEYTPGDLWLEFPFSPEYMAALTENEQTEHGGKTSVKILELLRENPEMTLADVAAVVGKTLRAVEGASSKLVAVGKLRHVGPQKGGHWEVLCKAEGAGKTTPKNVGLTLAGSPSEMLGNGLVEGLVESQQAILLSPVFQSRKWRKRWLFTEVRPRG